MVSHSDQFNIRWNNYTSVLQNVFRKLLEGEQFVDVTLACEGRSIKCHRVILSACSPYFEKMLTENSYPHSVIFVKDMKYWELQALVTFMYNGEVSVNRLSSLVKAAESLKIKGLAPDSSMTVNDTEKIDDDDLEEYQVGGLHIADGQVESNLSRNNHNHMEEQSLLKPNFHSSAKKSSMKRKITVSPPKLVKMQRMERNNSGNSATLSAQLSILSPEVLLNAVKQQRPKTTIKQETVVSASNEDDGVAYYDNENHEMMEQLEKEENYSDDEPEENGDTADEGNSREGVSSQSEAEDMQGTSSGENTVPKTKRLLGMVKTHYHSKYSKEVRDSAMAALMSGMSLRQCADSFGISRKTLSKWKSKEMAAGKASLKFSVKDLKIGLQEACSPVGTVPKKTLPNQKSSLSESQSVLGIGQSSMSDTENKSVSLPPGLHPKKIRMIRKHRVEILSEAALCILKGNTFRHVSEVYDVPKTTLRDFMVRRGLLQRGPPRKTVPGTPGSSSLSPSMKSDNFVHDGNVHDHDIL